MCVCSPALLTTRITWVWTHSCKIWWKVQLNQGQTSPRRFYFLDVYFSQPHPLSQIHTYRHTFHKEKECPVRRLPNWLNTFHTFHLHSDETTMNLSGLRQYHLSNMISVQKEWLQSLSAIPDPSTLCVWACLGVWYLHLCQVHRWIQIPWFAWTYPQHSARRERLHSPKVDMNRCCFIFTGR